MEQEILTTRDRGMGREMAVSGQFAALIAAGAFIKITIPVQPFPMHFTLQWFFVMMAGFLLGPKMAAASVGTYLLIGLLGVPVFAAGGGPAYLLRPTFGFLLGFLLAAWVIGKLCEWMKPSKMTRMMIPAAAGLAVYYGAGILYFYFISNYVISMPIGWKAVLINCCLLTIGEDFVLCILASATALKMRPAVLRMME